MKYKPWRGVLMNKKTELMIGCEGGYLCKYSLSIPTAPTLISSIQLSACINSLLKLSEDILLCG